MKDPIDEAIKQHYKCCECKNLVYQGYGLFACKFDKEKSLTLEEAEETKEGICGHYYSFLYWTCESCGFLRRTRPRQNPNVFACARRSETIPARITAHSCSLWHPLARTCCANCIHAEVEVMEVRGTILYRCKEYRKAGDKENYEFVAIFTEKEAVSDWAKDHCKEFVFNMYCELPGIPYADTPAPKQKKILFE